MEFVENKKHQQRIQETPLPLFFKNQLARLPLPALLFSHATLPQHDAVVAVVLVFNGVCVPCLFVMQSSAITISRRRTRSRLFAEERLSTAEPASEVHRLFSWLTAPCIATATQTPALKLDFISSFS